VKNLKVGDAITTIVSSGGYAEYASADANFAILVPAGISFAEASTIPVQGLSAYALLKFAANRKGTRRSLSKLQQAVLDYSLCNSRRSCA